MDAYAQAGGSASSGKGSRTSPRARLEFPLDQGPIHRQRARAKGSQEQRRHDPRGRKTLGLGLDLMREQGATTAAQIAQHVGAEQTLIGGQPG